MTFFVVHLADHGQNSAQFLVMCCVLGARGNCCGRITHIVTTPTSQSQLRMKELTNQKPGLYPLELPKAAGQRSFGRPIGEFIAPGEDRVREEL